MTDGLDREVFTDFFDQKVLLIKSQKQITAVKFCGDEEPTEENVEKCESCTKAAVQFCFGDSCTNDVYALQRLNKKLFVTFNPR